MNIPKFRAWDKETQLMLAVVGLSMPKYNADEIMVTMIFDDGGMIIRPLSKVELMQSASLKDDLLNDIFVGDIVCVDGEIAKVIFEDGVMMVEDEYGSRENLCDCSPIEVFGNIYENPEFLEGVKQ